MEIDVLQELEINGVKQWVYIRSQNKDHPILLFLHGGPGFPGIGIAQSFQSKLEDRFTVVQWDQRGAGKSYSPAIPKESMNIKQFLADLYELIRYLHSTISNQKIILAGHSWGAMLGALAVKEHPELFQYFIGIAPSVNLALTSEHRLSFLTEEAKNRNDIEALQKIEAAKKNGFGHLFQVEYDYVVKYGGAVYGKSDTNRLIEAVIPSTLYTDAEKQAIGMGMEFSGLLWNDISSVNLMESVTNIEVPVLFLSGKHDMLCPAKLTAQYYETVKAPAKQIVYFDASAHFPFLEETDRFCEVISKVDELLPAHS